MLEDICEANELLLVKVKIYESGDALTCKSLLDWKKGPCFTKLSGIGRCCISRILPNSNSSTN